MSEYYDVAQICINGHMINPFYSSSPQFNKNFCDKCGASTISKCNYCNTPILGRYRSHITTAVFKPSSFCHECGKAYPWTEAKLRAAQELSDEIENLTEEERETLKKSLDDIVRDTPQTPLASTRFKKIVAKAGKVAADGLKDILVDVASEAAKKLIWPS